VASFTVIPLFYDPFYKSCDTALALGISFSSFQYSHFLVYFITILNKPEWNTHVFLDDVDGRQDGNILKSSSSNAREYYIYLYIFS